MKIGTLATKPAEWAAKAAAQVLSTTIRRVRLGSAMRSLETYDSEVELEGIKSIDLLKMNIEGHELEAIRGAARTLERGGIAALIFEFGPGNVYSRTFVRDFWDLLIGYRIARIVPGSGALAVERYTDDLEYRRGATQPPTTWQRCTGRSTAATTHLVAVRGCVNLMLHVPGPLERCVTRTVVESTPRGYSADCWKTFPGAPDTLSARRLMI